MPLIYVEYRSRRPWAGQDLFHQVVGRTNSTWTDGYPEDLMLLNIGRTWRLGPEPEYLSIYYTPNASLDRITEWERIFTSGAVDYMEGAAKLAFRIDVAGCYEPLLEPRAGEQGPYYGEFFAIRPNASPTTVASFYKERQDRYPNFTLHLACHRIGMLGPDPGGLAIWGVPDYGALREIATELTDRGAPIELAAAGLYANVGSEIL